MATEHCDWYDTPLYYDIIFDADTPREGDFLEAVWQRHGVPGGARRLLEPACGSGRLMVEMAQRGWRVSGFDGNPRMLEFARQRMVQAKVKASLWQDAMQRFTLPGAAQFDLAHCLVSTFKYLLTEADAVACLQRVAAALRPGGLFVLGLHLTDYSRTRMEHERWVAERDGVHVVCNTRTWPADRQSRQERLRTRLRVRQAGREQLQETHWTFRTYDAAQLKALLRQVPELQTIACYDFTYDVESPRALDDRYADLILVLRR
jgi:SAM-dependent methyltransferase